jgi:protein tyrosine/serine phosphatase
LTRVLRGEGLLNVRDLGGVPLEDGGETAYGVVGRSDNVRRVHDRETFERHGITRVVDLRHGEEVAYDAHRELPVEVVNVPLMTFDPADMEDLADRALELEAAEYLEWSYLHFLERFRDNFGLAVRAIAAADGPVCVHCMGGRDRTGLITGLLLRLAGASREEVAEDYWLSEDALRARHEDWIAEAPNDRERRLRSVFNVAPREAMVGVLATLEEQYGSVRAYLAAAGVPDGELDALRARLRGEA